MLTRTQRLTAVPTLALAGLVLSATTASGADVHVNPWLGRGGTSSDRGTVDIGVGDPGSGGRDAKPVADKPKGGSGTSTCTFLGEVVDCASPTWGTWYPSESCYLRRMSPQPASTDPIWQDRTEGAIYWCQPPTGGPGGMGGGHMVWLPEDPTADLVDPVVLAERAVKQMQLVGVSVGATPLNGGDGVVGLQTWLWVDDPDEHTMGPISRTATAGSVSVTATAQVTKVVWDMGDGQDVTCTGAGTEWTPSKGTGESPTCGHTYLRDSGAQPGHAYTITPTTHWRVDWAGAGQTGVITFTLDGEDLPMRIVELQSLRVT